MRGRARALSRAPTARHGARRGGAALLGGGRAHECTASQGQAARREGTRPSGTKYTRSYLTCSGRGDGFSPTSTAAPADGGRVAAAAGISAAGDAAPGALVLVAMGLVAGHAASSATLVRWPRRGVVGPAACARRLEGGAGRRSGLRFDGRLGGGLARSIGDAHGLA